jgi:hypothetical protein
LVDNTKGADKIIHTKNNDIDDDSKNMLQFLNKKYINIDIYNKNGQLSEHLFGSLQIMKNMQ